MYLELGGKVFEKRTWRRWEALFEARPLDQELAAMFGERTLGDRTLTTGLCIVTKRADTGSTWPLNMPRAVQPSICSTTSSRRSRRPSPEGGHPNHRHPARCAREPVVGVAGMDSSASERLHVPGDAGRTIQIGGFGTTVKVADQLASSSVAVVEHTLAPGVLGALPHRHQHEDEISYVLEGVLAVQLGDDVVTAEPGEFVIKPRGQFHAFWNAGTETLRFIEVISPGGFERYFEELAALVPEDRPPDMDAIAALAGRYGLAFDSSGVEDLVRRHGVRLG
jgi:quercetin dioxygenase-like cupin family protein